MPRPRQRVKGKLCSFSCPFCLPAPYHSTPGLQASPPPRAGRRKSSAPPGWLPPASGSKSCSQHSCQRRQVRWLSPVEEGGARGGVSGHGWGFLGQLVTGPGQKTPAVITWSASFSVMLQARPSSRDFIDKISLYSHYLTWCFIFAKHLSCICERVASISFSFGGCARKELEVMQAGLKPSAEAASLFQGSCGRTSSREGGVSSRC